VHGIVRYATDVRAVHRPAYVVALAFLKNGDAASSPAGRRPCRPRRCLFTQAAIYSASWRVKPHPIRGWIRRRPVGRSFPEPRAPIDGGGGIRLIHSAALS